MLSKFNVRTTKTREKCVVWVRSKKGEWSGTWVKSRNSAHGSLKIGGTSGTWQLYAPSKVMSLYAAKKKTPVVLLDHVPSDFDGCGSSSSGGGSVLLPDSWTESVRLDWKCEGGVCV